MIFCQLALPLCARADEHFISAQAAIDNVIALADERMSLMPAVAAYKWENKAPIMDIERERAVTTRAVDVARSMGLAPEGVRAVFDLQVRAAREAQARLHEAWRAHGFDFPAPIPSLERDLRPKLDRFTVEFLRALYLVAFSRTDFATSYVTASDRLHAPGWTEADKRELLAALGRVQRPPATDASSPAPLARISAAGVLLVGTTGDYAPFSVERDGALSGADVELAQSLAKRLGVSAKFVQTAWPTLLDDLHAEKFDLAIGGISVTPARAAVASFSVPYSSGGKTILTRCADKKRYKTLASVDRRGVRVIVNPGGTNEQYVRENVHRATVVVFSDNRAIFDEIRANHADVMITDDVEVELQTRHHKDMCRAFAGTLTHGTKAILMPQDSSLAGPVNVWLSEAIEAGEPVRMLNQNLSRPAIEGF